MRRKFTFVAGLTIVVSLAVVLWHAASPGADPGDKAPQPPAKEQPPAATIPVTQVILFNSGMGFYHREGDVTGDARVDLAFPEGDINDLLKSLILEDQGKGQVGAVTYDSHDPLEKTLGSFAINLSSNPSLGRILNQTRGEKVEVTRVKKDGPAAKVTGVIVGLEVQTQHTDKDRPVEVEALNLLADDGLQGIPLHQVQSVKFLNPVLQSEFQKALQVLAGAHDTQKKKLSLHFSGQGKRHVKVGYVVEQPIWKTTYRLVVNPNGKLFVQGWALVENTSDEDWKDVRMILVSGRPISFQMNLYESLYVPRPVVEPELFAQLRPQIYAGALDGALKLDEAKKALEKLPPGERIATEKLIKELDKQIREEKNIVGQILMGKDKDSKKGESKQDEKAPGKVNDAIEAQAKKVGAHITGINFKDGVTSMAAGEELGDYHQYVINQKVTLGRQKSAMLPILNQDLEGHKVSIFNDAVHPKHPLLGLRVKNTSGQPLTQGPITVYEAGAYAGDTRVLDLQPGEERLLSYALDQATEVKVTSQTAPGPDMSFQLGGDKPSASYNQRQTRTYTLKNRGTADRQVIVEQPIRAEWKLLTPDKGVEKSRDVYRFLVAVPAGKTVTLDVVEEQHRVDFLALTGVTDGMPYYAIASGIEVKPLVKVLKDELKSLKITKGVVQPRLYTQTSKTYVVRNDSDVERVFSVDHLIAKGAKRVGGEDGPAVYRFKLTVPVGKTGLKEVVEEETRSHGARELTKVSDEEVKAYLLDPAPAVKVKEALRKYLDLKARATATKAELDDHKAALKVLTEDQARLRENLKVVPPTSDAYKGFLEKFVTQDGQIEAAQKQGRQLEAALHKEQRAVEAYAATLTVE